MYATDRPCAERDLLVTVNLISPQNKPVSSTGRLRKTEVWRVGGSEGLGWMNPRLSVVNFRQGAR